MCPEGASAGNGINPTKAPKTVDGSAPYALEGCIPPPVTRNPDRVTRTFLPDIIRNFYDSPLDAALIVVDGVCGKAEKPTFVPVQGAKNRLAQLSHTLY